ncbi:MAG: HIT family protein [bacterium]
MKDNNCIFCKIVAKEIPAEIVYEDKDLLAFIDVNPVHLGHTLLIPKEHYVWMQEAPDNIISKIFLKTKQIMLAMKKGFSSDYIKLGVVGNEVPHFHIHLIPKKLNENREGRITYTSAKQMTEYADKIRKNL